MSNNRKFLIIALVLSAMIGIYINESRKGPSEDAHDHSVSQLTVLEKAVDEKLPLMIEFSTHT